MPIRGKERLLSLGTYPEVSQAKVRDSREETHQQLAADIDPSTARKGAKRVKQAACGKSIRTIARRWLENVKPAEAGIHRTATVRHFEAFVFRGTGIGWRPIAKTTAAELQAEVRELEARRTLVTAHDDVNS